MSEMTEDLTSKVNSKYSWLKLNWTSVNVMDSQKDKDPFPVRNTDDNAFCTVILVDKNELKEEIANLDEVSVENLSNEQDYMQIFSEDTENTVFLRVFDIDQGQFLSLKAT